LTFDNKPRTFLVVECLGIMPQSTDLLQGTLDLLVLKTLRLGPLHGWGISKLVRQLSSDVLRINQGSLYPALYRLEERGLIEAEWGISPEGRKAKFYSLTAKGRDALVSERSNWRAFAGAVEAVLRAT
jgi:PadR family transcriptional regulator